MRRLAGAGPARAASGGNGGRAATRARSWPGAAAGLLGLAALLALPLQAQAQSTDPVWSTTMTVGQATGDIRGYDPRNSPGTLDVDEFTVSGVVYDVRVLVVGPVKGAEFWISPALTGNPVLPNKDDYILEVAGVQLPLTGITNSGTDFFKWHPDWLVPNASSLDPDNFEATLPLDGEVTVCLRTTTQICPKAPDPLPWSTTMTVGDASGNGRGFQVAGYANYDEAGSLGVSEFTVPGDQAYQVLLLAVDTDWQNGAAIVLSSGLANEDDYILELAGVELPLDSSVSISVVDGSTNFFAWFTPWLAANAPALDADTYETTLPLDGEVTVCLRTTTQVCPGGGTLSTDATLSALVVNDGTTDHTIDLATTPYTLNVGNAVTTVTLTATTTHTGAAVSAVTLGGNAIDDTVFTDGITVPSLAEGDNVIVVTVTAEDGSTEPYTVTVTREAAATTCLAPTFAGRTEVWRGTITVGNDSFTFGYNTEEFDEFGELSDPKNFDYGGNNYTIEGIYEDANSNRLDLDLGSFLPESDRAKLRLHLCGDTFDLTAASKSGVAGNYWWSDAVVDWSTATTIEVALSGTIPAPAIVTDGVEVTSTAATDDTYGLGETIEITVTFDNAVTVDTTSGTPRIRFILNGGGTSVTKWAEYSSGSGGTALVFDYTVQLGDKDDDGIWLPGDSLGLQSGTIRAAGTTVDATLTYAQPGTQIEHNVNGSPAIVTDGVQVTSTAAADETYRLGETIEITVTFDTAVTVDTTGGTPRIQFRLGPPPTDKWAVYSSGSGGTDLMFDYTVQLGDLDNDGIWLEEDLLQLQSGTIRATADNTVDATLTYPDPGLQTEHKVNGTPAIVTDGVQVMSTPKATVDTYGLDETIEITVTFDNAVTVDTSGGTPRIQFRLGPPRDDRWAEYSSGSGGTVLVFTYTVLSGDVDDNGILLPGNFLELQSGTIRAAADNTVDATLTYADPGLQSEHKVNGSLTTTDDGPKLVSATVDAAGDQIALIFDQVLDSLGPSAATGSMFDVTVGGTSTQIDNSLRTYISTPGGDVDGYWLDVASGALGFEPGATVVVEYTDPTASDDTSAVQNTSGVDAASFITGMDGVPAVVNNSTNHAPTSSDNTVTAIRDTDYTFTASDFPFFDDNADDTLGDVRITSLPGAGEGTLKENGTAISSVPRDIQRSDLDDGELTYSPPAGETGAGLATFKFKVGDGNISSVAEYTMTVDVVAADNVAPRVASIERQTPSSSPTNADSLTWRVTFNEPVTGVGADGADFAVAGTSATPTVAEVSTSEYDVTASGGDLAGLNATVTLSFASGQDIADTADNALSNTAPTGVNQADYVVDNTRPTVAITVPDTSTEPFTATFTFSEAVTGFALGDIGVGTGVTASEFMTTSTSVYTALITPAATGTVTVDVADGEATDLAGNGNRAAPQATSDYTDSNEPPLFVEIDPIRTVAENTASGMNIGDPVTAIDPDDDPLTYTLEGADAGSFDIDAGSGQLRTSAALDYETKASYTLTVKADDKRGGTETFTVTVNVTDVDEKPATPAQPTVTATTDTTDSVTVSWTKPALNGGPDIVSYKLRYEVTGSGSWTETTLSGTGTMAPIGSLTEDTEYAVQVMALNGETPSDWSASGTGRTGGGSNAAPTFNDGASTTREVAENTASGQPVGKPVTASDPDGDTLDYTLEGGPDAGSFAIGLTSGQLRTVAALDHETKDSYTLTVKADDGRGGTDTIEVTVKVTLVDEAALVCNMFMDPNPLTAHEGETANFTIKIDPPLAEDDTLLWWVHPHGEASTPEDIPSTSGRADLKAGATQVVGAVTPEINEETEPTEAFQIIMDWASWRALRDWRSTPSCVGTIYIRDGESNGAPEFADDAPPTRKVAENTASGQPVGKPVTAEDPNDDPVTYVLEGRDRTSFSIDAGTGQLRTSEALDHEKKAIYTLRVRADDDQGGTATIAVTVNVEDEREPPGTPDAPSVSASGRSLLVSWKAPANTGPPMTYDLRHREPGRGWRTDGPRDVDGRSAMLDGLDPDTEYEVQVLAHSDEGVSGWSPPTLGSTGTNGPPVFDDGARATRNVAENTASGQPVGPAVSANDPEGDTLTYTLEGPDADSFRIDSGTGRLSTRAALDHEEKAAYEVTVKADDGNEGGTATIRVTVEATDVDEPPQAPEAPLVEGSGTSLSVRWIVPANTGPPMTYELRYRETGGSWTGGPKNVAGRSASIDELDPNTDYDVQVQAHNDEGASGWSASGRGRTDGGGASSVYMADVTVHEGEFAPFTIDISPPAKQGDRLIWYTRGNSRAVEGKDFVGADKGIILEADQTEVEGRVQVLKDNETEDEERFQISISYGDGSDSVEYVGSIYIRDGPNPASASPSARAAPAGRAPAPAGPPPAVSIADAKVEEGPGAVLAFAVTLDRASQARATVDWATRDGDATAGHDYVAGSGTLRFSPGETAKTIRVAVRDDSHDEGREVMLVVLSNPVGATIAKAAGTGTIDNTDPMPQAWLGRFGRAASDHVVEAISDRWRDGERQTPQTHFTLGGRKVDKLFGGWDGIGGMFESSGPGQGNPALEDESTWVRMDRLKAEALGPAGGGLAGGGLAGGNLVGSSLTGGGSTGRSPAGSSLTGGGTAGRSPAGRSPAGRSPGGGATSGGEAARSALMNRLGLPSGDLRDVLMGSSFFYSRQLDEDGRAERPGWLGQWSAWGETAATRFSGADGKLSLNGEVATAILGADSRRDRWLAGVTLSQSMGEGAYTHPTAVGGAVSSTLTSLNPYVHYRLNERTSFWGVAGYGVGGLKLTPDGVETGIETDLATTMAAFGGRGVLSVRTGGAGRFELALRSDALLTNTDSEAVQGLVGAQGATSRVRLVLEGSGSLPVRGGVLRPTLEAGLRYDGGDAETGAGLEVGGGLGYAAGNLSLEVKARALVAHQDTEYEEWGFSGSVVYTPGKDRRGLSMKLGSAWGSTQSGVQSLWSRQDASGLARGAGMIAAQRFQAEVGYGFAGRRNADALWVPFLGAESGEGAAQSLRMGVRLTSGPNVEMGLELGRREGRAGAAPEQTLQLRGALRW